MEHLYFEAQLCINISKFKEISNIDILINLCLGTSIDSPPLLIGFSFTFNYNSSAPADISVIFHMLAHLLQTEFVLLNTEILH